MTFSCKCEDGEDADLEEYKNTIPFFVCQTNFGNCIADHPDDADGQDQCKKDNQCGSKNATEATTSSSKSDDDNDDDDDDDDDSSSTSASSSSMPSSVDAVSSGSSNSPTSSPNAALIQQHPTGLLAAALFVAARLVL